MDSFGSITTDDFHFPLYMICHCCKSRMSSLWKTFNPGGKKEILQNGNYIQKKLGRYAF